MAQQSLPTIRREVRALSALIGTIALFATLHAGYTFVDSAVSKWNDPTWTGHRAGTAISGFLNGAEQKATPSDKNPHPDVLPATRDLNHAFIRNHPRLFSWLVAIGELCLPIGVLILLCMRFRGSRPLALLCAGLAALLNLVYLLEGSSGLNPPMLVLWLTVLWLLATLPAATLFYALDLRVEGNRTADERQRALGTKPGQWVFYTIVLFVAGICGWVLHPGWVFLALTLATAILAAVLFAINSRMTRTARQIGPQLVRQHPDATV